MIRGYNCSYNQNLMTVNNLFFFFLESSFYNLFYDRSGMGQSCTWHNQCIYVFVCSCVLKGKVNLKNNNNNKCKK